MLANVTRQNAYLPAIAATSAAGNTQRDKTLPVSADALEPTPSTITNLTQSTALSELAKRYDIRNVSPRDMVKLGNELQEAGLISGLDAAVLTSQPELSPSYNAEDIGGYRWRPSDPDTPRDFLAQWQSTLRFDESVGNHGNINRDKLMVNLLGNLAALHDQSS